MRYEGTAGNDRWRADAASWEAYGNAGNDTLSGGAAADRLIGGGGDDRLEGGGGDDMLFAAEEYLDGYDTLFGGKGDDTLDGGTGADRMSGGEGDDFYTVNSAKDVIKDTGGFDTVTTTVDYRLGRALENLIVERAATVHGNDKDNVITGSSGKDVIYGEGGNDAISGGKGADTIYGGSGDDQIDGGSGDDVIYAGGNSTVIGGKGHDVVYWGKGTMYVTDGVEAVHLTGQSGYAVGNEGDNLMTGSDKGGNTLIGAGGDDTLIGGAKDDNISGNYGNDLLTGGRGADTFYFDQFSTTVVDEITDYSSVEGDILDFRALESEAGQAGVTAINYLGTGAFTGHKGEARTELHDGYGLFMFDLNGDKVSDLTIKLDGVTDTSSVLFVLV